MKLNQHKSDKRKTAGLTKHQTRKYSRWSFKARSSLPWAQGDLRSRWYRPAAPKSAW